MRYFAFIPFVPLAVLRFYFTFINYVWFGSNLYKILSISSTIKMLNGI